MTTQTPNEMRTKMAVELANMRAVINGWKAELEKPDDALSVLDVDGSVLASGRAARRVIEIILTVAQSVEELMSSIHEGIQ